MPRISWTRGKDSGSRIVTESERDLMIAHGFTILREQPTAEERLTNVIDAVVELTHEAALSDRLSQEKRDAILQRIGATSERF